jgi:alpha-1,6-mannosyltransferase
MSVPVMSYAILNPEIPLAMRASQCALAVMAKAPRAGKVKTRLAPPLTFEQSAAINICFLRDTTENIAAVAVSDKAAGVISYTPVGDEVLFDGLLPADFVLIPQRGDGFGERLLGTTEDLLGCGYGSVCLIDSDSPTVPAAAFEQAVTELQKEGDRIVLGPSHDGGYYLIGLKRAHTELFANITWSTSVVFAETVAAAEGAGIEVVVLPLWYDVDDNATLDLLKGELLRENPPSFTAIPGYDAVHTRNFLLALEQGGERSAVDVDMNPAMRAGVGIATKAYGGWRWTIARPWQTNAALLLIGTALFFLTRQLVSEYSHYTIGFSGVSGWSCVLYLAATFLILTQPVDRFTFPFILTVAIACRVVALFGEPFLSSDIYRYVWDGVVQHAHISPYRYVPGDPALAFLRAPNQHVFDHINRRDYAHTIYPPAAQALFYLITWVSPTVVFMKTVMVLFEGVTMYGLIALLHDLGVRREQTVLYAWCPILIWEIAGSGHLDSPAMAFIALALLARYRKQSVLTGLFLGIAILLKLYPLVLFPALYRRGDVKMPAMVAAVVAFGYAAYSGVGMLVFGFLGGYVKEEGMATGARYFLLELAQRVPGLRGLSTTVYYLFCAAIFAAVIWWCWQAASRQGTDGYRPTADAGGPSSAFSATFRGGDAAFLAPAFSLAAALMFLFSPHYAWYIIWLVPFLTLMPNLPILTYVLGFFYLYTTALAEPGAKMFVANEILYTTVFAAFIIQIVLRRWPVHCTLFVQSAPASEPL